MSEEITNSEQNVSEELIDTPSFLSGNETSNNDYGVAPAYCTACESVDEGGVCGFCESACEMYYQAPCEEQCEICEDICEYEICMGACEVETGGTCQEQCQICEDDCQTGLSCEGCEYGECGDCEVCENGECGECESAQGGGDSDSSTKAAYIGVGGVAKKIKKQYIGVGGVAHKVKKAYIGVGGVAKLFYSLGAPGKTYAGYTITSQSGSWSFDISAGNDSLWIGCTLTHKDVIYTDEFVDGDDVYYNDVYDDPFGAGYAILRNADGFVTDLQEEVRDMSPWYVLDSLDTSQLADTGKAYFHAHCTLGDCGDAHIDVEIQFT